MIAALPAPGAATLLTQWAWQPVAIMGVVLLGVWYARAVHRLRKRSPARGPAQGRVQGKPWPAWRAAVFAAGLLLAVWTSCGFFEAYVDSLFWAWTAQVLVLWLLVPGVLLVGQPLQLALATAGRNGLLARFLRSRLARVFGNPLVGPALVPLLSMVLFFGPLPGWAIQVRAVGWLLAPLLVVLGALMLLPLLGVETNPTSLAVALTLALGSFELVLDAIPGIVLRLHTRLATSYFDHRVLHPWSTTHLRDQQTAGAILWVVAELIDLPFLLLVYRRWLRADERDAAAVDAVLEAEHAARAALDGPEQPGTATADVPWWVSDPTMQHRFRERG